VEWAVSLLRLDDTTVSAIARQARGELAHLLKRGQEARRDLDRHQEARIGGEGHRGGRAHAQNVLLMIELRRVAWSGLWRDGEAEAWFRLAARGHDVVDLVDRQAAGRGEVVQGGAGLGQERRGSAE
jgi:hypothetical protein